MSEVWAHLATIDWKAVWDVVRVGLDATIVFVLVYQMLLLIKGTQAVQMLLGLAVLILLSILSKEEHLGLTTLNWILDKFLGAFLFIVIVIFQADIRRGLAQVGKNPLFRSSHRQGPQPYLEDVVQAAALLGSKHIGALIAIERDGDLTTYADNGVPMDAQVTHETLQSIFIPFKQNPLHDGAAILRAGRVVAARCILPFSTNPRYNHLGSRHRAALGLSELTDALVVVVSEETGGISMAVGGELTSGLDSTSLRLRLTQSVMPEVSEIRAFWKRQRKSGILSSWLFRRDKKGNVKPADGGDL